MSTETKSVADQLKLPLLIQHLLSDDFEWSKEKIETFVQLLEKTGIQSKLNEALCALTKTNADVSKKDAVKVLNDILQKYWFRDKPDRVLKQPIANLQGTDPKELKDATERFQMQGIPLQAKTEHSDAQKKALQYIEEVHDLITKFGAFAPEELQTKSCHMLFVLGASFPPCAARIAHTATMLDDQGFSADHIFLLSGQRQTEEDIDLKKMREAGFKETPKNEIEMMTIVAKARLAKHAQRLVPIDAPMREVSNSDKFIMVRPDTTYTAVIAGKKIGEMWEAGKLPKDQTLSIVCVTEAPNHGAQLQQVITGLQTSGLSAEILDKLQVSITGPGISASTTKEVELGLSAIAGETNAMTQRPALKPMRQIQSQNQSGASITKAFDAYVAAGSSAYVGSGVSVAAQVQQQSDTMNAGTSKAATTM